MGEDHAIRTASVGFSKGFHGRPMSGFVELARRFESRVVVLPGGLDGKSILELSDLEDAARAPGEELRIKASGPDAEEAADSLARYVETPGVDEVDLRHRLRNLRDTAARLLAADRIGPGGLLRLSARLDAIRDEIPPDLRGSRRE